MAKKDDRFLRTYKQGGFSRDVEIWIDKKTGVNYLWMSGGYSGGLTVLLDRDGRPVVTSVPRERDE